MSDAVNKAVFLSYASQDAEAVERIAEALRAAGIEVWFDKNELVGGDAWDQKIRGQVKTCALFLPVISANTQARLEGYFRLEWKLAAQRTHTMADAKPFLMPVMIDATHDADAHVPEEFRAVQWTRLLNGETPEKFCVRVKKLIEVGPMESARPRVATEPARAAETEKITTARRPWLAPAALAAAVIALALWQPWKKSAPPPRPAETVSASAPTSDARKLLAQARSIFDDGDESNHETLLLAEDILKKALALDSTDGEIWAVAAQLSRTMGIVGFDRSLARRAILKQQAERALALAPNSIEAQVAYAGFVSDSGGSGPAEAVRVLEPLSKQYPEHRRLWENLGIAHSSAGNIEAAIAAFDRANALPGGDARGLAQKGAQLIWHGRYAEAEDALKQSLALKPNGRAQVFGVLMMLSWRGDLEGAAAAMERWPAWLKLEPRGAIMASQVWLWRHEPEKAITAIRSIAADAWSDTLFSGPKSVLLALAYEMAGQPDAARGEWENARKVADRLLVADPDNRWALVYKACALAKLGEREAAEKIYREVEQARDLRSEFWSCAAPSALLRILLGHGSKVPEKFDQEWRIPRVVRAAPSPQAALRLNPVFDPIRATPEFQKWMAAAPAPEEKKETKTSAASPGVNEKSLVVLPLENLSPDPENAFFTDGMHAEIISTLGQIADLKVISRTSALAFKGSTASLAEIAQKLGVANVLTGSVRRAGNTVRIQLELRRASDEALLWSLPKGDRDLKDVLGLQSEIADQVARVLQARASKGSFAGAQFTTKDPRAYDLFLKAHQLFDWRGLDNQLESVRLAEGAMRLDPTYGTAANLLSHSHQRVFSQDPNPETRVEHARESKRWGEITQKLMPGGAGDGALSMYYSITEHDGARALSLAENVQRALPNDAESYNYLGVAMEELGRYQEAVDCFVRAEEISPLVANYPRNLLRLYARLRREREARTAAERYRTLASAPAPQSANRHAILDGLFLVGGDLPSDFTGLSGAQKALWLWRARRFEQALAESAAVMTSGTAEYPARLTVLVLNCDALRRLGRETEAGRVAREMVALADKLQVAPEVGPTEKPFWLALAYSRVGRMDDAVAAMGRFVDASSPANQTTLHWEREVRAAELFAYANRPHECCELLAKLLRIPSGLTVPTLKVDPTWDNVRDNPAFQALLGDPKNSAPL